MTEATKAVIEAELAKVKAVSLEAGKEAGKKIGRAVAAAAPKILEALAADSANKLDDMAVAIVGPKLEQGLNQIVDGL
jgi:cell pole-organizing protein PopZ